MTPPFDPTSAARVLLDVRAGAPRPAGLPATPADTAGAYAVQTGVMRALGGRVSWKMALLGGRDRHAAPMPAGEVAASGASLPALPHDAAIEVETAFILGADLPAKTTPATALDAVAEVRLAFELVASRYADRTAVPPLAVMADSFSSAGIVLGDVIPDWRGDLNQPLGLTLALDGLPVAAPEQAPTLSDTAEFLAWLATHAAEQDMPLVAGTVIITGARIGPIPLHGAQEAVAGFGPRQVRVAFSAT
ncbi:fumarylacetoacetate hydrolase family protein [Paracoccus nototheniae]|uniref:Fumarylacetoacetate hydrolase family protein n=1 Tax=Paracoccus nototheniae TaxID=2489002 RepID=A0ABW4E070_9RHOB|nr:fumarylacetoacetate hydrolase family protein [Paracoccus nototheniae]